MILREQDKHFLWSIYSAITIIFLWKGIWEGLYHLPFIGDEHTAPWIFLFIGLAMLTFSGIIFKEFDPLGGLTKAATKVVSQIQHHPHKDDFNLCYVDHHRKETVTINAKELLRLEKGTLVFKHHSKNQEVFVPLHRLTEVTYQGKRYWRL